MIVRRRILITGRVQGVGFRPAVYRIARAEALTGLIFNDTSGVTVELQGPAEAIDRFIEALRGPEKPPVADIRTLKTVEIPLVEGETDFRIASSDASGSPISQVAADLATCRDCLAELADPADFRYRYPFINCTNCGPRYSIVKTIPYDRPNTTMSPFEMCDRCAAQYSDVADRRFHAQPVACPDCGPQISLIGPDGDEIAHGTDPTIQTAAEMLASGKVLAIKGVGGYHLAADAANDDAVMRLRRRKRRDHKPFALMADSVETIRRHAVVDETSEALLKSPEAPILLLPALADAPIAPSVAEGVSTLGFMLCYAPLHHLLLAAGPGVLVMTSGNISDEPLICRDDNALARLGDVADAFLVYDRLICRQVDDSVIHIIDGGPALLRRARGYVPTPVTISAAADRHILAAGSDLKNTFALVKDDQLICSEHIGDLADADVYRHYCCSIDHLRALFELEPELVACDVHPGYLSSQYTRSLGVEIVEVQHHWAHVAAVLAEHGLAEPVIGLVCDGTGYGTDGAIWGCECLIASLEGFDRFGHLAYYDLPGADRASKQPVRPLISLLRHAFGDDFDLDEFAWLLDPMDPDARLRHVVAEQLDKKLNVVATSSLGRVFDAAAAMLGLGDYNHFDAQLPMALEAIAAADIEDAYEFELTPGEPAVIDLRRLIRALVEDIRTKDTSTSVISAKFHNTLAAAMLETAHRAREACGLETAALSGGVFCNRYLANRLIRLLKRDGFSVLWNRQFPSNDGCIAVGQAAVAVSRTRGRRLQP